MGYYRHSTDNLYFPNLERLKGNSETKLLIKIDSEVYPEFREESVIHWYQLMGDLGGVIGLWLGASFVGVLHFIEFVLRDFIWTRRLKRVISQS